MIEPLIENLLSYWYMWIVGILLFGISIGFVARFVLPALRIGRELSAALAALGNIKELTKDRPIELEAIAQQAMQGERLAHLWGEYAETLHPQSDAQGKLPRWRATALAESFFTEQVLVDTPLKSEFYKHLPGILTGLGIIGTFTGLIVGLIHFDVSLDPGQAQAQLRNLINSVGHAFFASAIAISLAMLFTWIEKSLVTARYKQVEDICRLVDGMFSVGAGEEYLERLVTSSETSATQARQLKEELFLQLKETLSELVSRQMEASALQSKRLAVDIANVIRDSLGGPISDIALAVRMSNTNQGEAVNRVIDGVLLNFASRMQEMFGGQMHAMNDMLMQTSQSMRATATHFEQLSQQMNATGKAGLTALTEKLEQTLAAMENRQQTMQTQTGEFLTQLRMLVGESQTESNRRLQEALAMLGDQTAGMIGQLQQQASAVSAHQEQQAERISRQANEAVSSIAGQLERLLAQSTDASRSLQATVENLSQTTGNAIAGMNNGADTLYIAASEFAKARQGVSETMQASLLASEQIHSAAQTLSAVAESTREMLGDYGKTSAAFSLMLSDLKGTFENAKREASMTADLVDKLQTAAGQLSSAQRVSGEYLNGISEVLGKAHQSFSENIERTLRESNRQFQRELSLAVGLLSGAIKDLGDTLDDLPGKR
ncbi:MAG: anti-phage ZorAB system protein ZorA [Sterolibacterium sp.]